MKEENNKQVMVVRIQNGMTPLQRSSFNAILTLGKNQLDIYADKSFARVDLSLDELSNLMQLEHMNHELAFEKLREIQKISAEVEVFGANGRRKEIRFFKLISEFRIPSDKSNENLISIYLPWTIRERLTNLDINAVMSIADQTY